MANERLIDANAMHKWVEDKVANKEDAFADGVPYEWAYALTAVDMQPTVDAVPVVRCKDCKNYKSYGTGLDGFESFGKCLYINMDVDMPVGGYCCYGERRNPNG